MNPTILNRDFEHPTDGWYQIEPKGEHANAAAGVVQVIDDAAIESIVNRFNGEAQRPNFPGMLVDHEHFKHDTDKETRAYGWLMRLQNREDGVYGQIKWTATGRAAVDGGDYRYFSTEYDRNDLKVLNAAAASVKLEGGSRHPYRRVQPLRLDGLTLTNNPNNKGGRPITNRGVERSEREASERQQKEFRRGLGGPSVEKTETKNKNRKMKSVATQLKLSADASEEAVLAEVIKIVNRAETAETELVKVTNRRAELEKENGILLGEQVDGLLAEYGISEERVINRLKPMLLPLKNRGDREGALADLGHKKAEAGKTNGKPPPVYEGHRPRLLNREDTKTPSGQTGAAAEDDSGDHARAEKIKNRASELQGVAPGRNWESCWAQAVRESQTAKS